MGFWLFMTGCNLLFPAIMLIAGKLFMKGSPKEINHLVGYRTALSMKNEETWRFAHRFAGERWWKWGWWMIPVAVIPMLLVLGGTEDAVAAVGTLLMCVELIPMILVIPLTERALRRHFDRDGNPKTE